MTDEPIDPSRGGYTEEQRGDIRRQLLGYMERHGIGTPTLQARIAESGGRSNYEVNNKTLQRFLANRHRTNDAFVWLCHKFLLGVDAEDPTREFGDAICRFHRHEAGEEALARAAGDYELQGTPEEGDNRLAAYGRLSLARVPGRPFLRASESVVSRDALPDRAHENPFLFEGVALVQAKGLSVVLRDMLTRHQKWNLLYPAAAIPGSYSGTITERIFHGHGTGASRIVRVSAEKDEARKR